MVGITCRGASRVCSRHDGDEVHRRASQNREDEAFGKQTAQGSHSRQALRKKRTPKELLGDL